MSNMDKVVKNQRTIEKIEKENIVSHKVTNFMGGDSFELNAIDTLKMVTASSIFGEPAYYRNGEFNESTCMRVQKGETKNKKGIVRDGIFNHSPNELFGVIDMPEFDGKTTTEVMETAIDNALAVDFGAVISWAKVLRKEYLMRLNPQVIMVRAAMHPAREEWTSKNPGEFAKTNEIVMSRADDVIAQLTYWLYINGSKNGIPNILKRSWANRIEKLSRYEIAKYKNHGIGLVDTIRISHTNCSKNENLVELVKLSKGEAMPMDENETTWERLRSNGKSWVEILDTIKMPHMALLRNLRGIFNEVDDADLAQKVMEQLINGVSYGKQFPFRYMSAYRSISNTTNNATILKDGLEECLDKACENLPKLKGRNAFLSDNSGSAWGTATSEYGSVVVAEIGNLSSFIGAVNSEEGHVFAFGDKLIKADVSKRNGILGQAKDFSKKAHTIVGQSTENGIWLFLRDAIDKEQHWDNIFIFSDMQAGHGGLYGTSQGKKEYLERGYGCKQYIAKSGNFSYQSEMINVAKLIDVYRKKVNPKVNVYCVQTAGYDNMLIPENSYRTNFLYGWTGKELVYADAMNKFWDEKDESLS